MHTLSKILFAPFLLLASFFHRAPAPDIVVPYTPAPVELGASLPSGVAVFETSLQSAITTSATSMTLAANSVQGGSTLSGFNCFTIDEGSAQAEYVCGTVSSTSVTGMTRGVDPVTATTTNATLQFAHRRGANIKITDFPLIQIMRNQLNGIESISNIMVYNQNFTFASDTQIVSKKYVDGLAIAGAPDSSLTAKGILEKASGAEAASGAADGSGNTTAPLALTASIATSTCDTVANSVLVSSSTTGKLGGKCVDTAYSYNYTGPQTFNATTTISASSVTNNALKLNGLAYSFPSSRAASSTVLMENGSGSLTWNALNPVHYTSSNGVLSSTALLGATTTIITIPAGTLNASSTIQFIGSTLCANADTTSHNCTLSIRDSSGVPYWTATISNGGNGSSSIIGSISGFITMNSSVSSQLTSVVGVSVAPAPNTQTTNIGANTQTSINFANQQTLVLFASVTNTSATAQIGNFSVIVNP